MRVQELIELTGSTKNKLLKADQLQELIKKSLEVKSYISIKDKKILVESIVNECILYGNGAFKFDDIDKYICFTMRVIEAYTNLELSNDYEEDYDMLCESGLLNIVIDTFKKEYDEISILLQMKCEYILSENNIEAQVGKFLSNILEKIDDFANIMGDKFANFDISKLPVGEEELLKLLEFVNSQKK